MNTVTAMTFAKTLVWVFPGQGSQYKGMGAQLFARFAPLVRQADEVLGYSIAKLCLEDPDGVLGQTQFTQPALFVTSALAYLHKREQSDLRPDYFAGHSLGEFNALFAAGGVDFQTGVALVQKRGQLMSQAPRGAMAAVLGLDLERVRTLLANLPFTIDIANINSSQQIVISGPYEDIERCEALFVGAGARYVRLNVSAAFHSRLMQGVEAEFADFVSRMPLQPLAAEVIANCTARPYPKTGYQERLIKQITATVKWHESISWLLSRGEVALEEVGPGDVLTKLFFKIQQAPMQLPETAGGVATSNDTSGSKPGKRRTVFMYSGQGSHYYAMGQELYRENAVFRQAMDSCDALSRSLTGQSMLAQLYDDARKPEELTDVLLSHPALFSVGYSLTQVLLDRGICPDCVLGYSLGEYVAATVAGVIRLEDAMAMVVQQARLLTERAQGGGMLTILSSVEHYERHPDLYAGAALASVNFDRNFVVSGRYETLAALKQRLDELGLVCLLLSVQHGFHSPAVDPIEAEFRQFVAGIKTAAPQLPMYSAMRVGVPERFDVQYFWDVIRCKVEFRKLVGLMSTQEEFRFVDLGPSGTLSSFIKYGFGGRVQHAASINQFGRNVQTVAKLLADLAA